MGPILFGLIVAGGGVMILFYVSYWLLAQRFFAFRFVGGALLGGFLGLLPAAVIFFLVDFSHMHDKQRPDTGTMFIAIVALCALGLGICAASSEPI